MLYLSETAALPVRSARPPPAETTRCVDRQITAHLTFAGGERYISVCAVTTGRHCRRRVRPAIKKTKGKSAFLWRLDTVSLGKDQRNGVELALRGKNLEKHNGAHVQTQKGGNPLIGFPPWTPFLIFLEQKGEFRA